ncbi:hypothetical protein B5G50_29705, partial [Brevibacillus brevis]|uniref:hypothetical protein n=1 Tax=Brevibacillus brevis TaxID=1393 RepID=UPI000B574414
YRRKERWGVIPLLFFHSIFIMNEIILDFLLHLKFIRAILNFVSGTHTKRTQRKTNQMPV